MRLAGVERAAVIDKGGPSSESDCAKLNLLSWMDNIMTNLMLINLKRDSSYNNFISRTLRSRYTFTDSVSLFKFMLEFMLCTRSESIIKQKLSIFHSLADSFERRANQHSLRKVFDYDRQSDYIRVGIIAVYPNPKDASENIRT